MDVYQEILNDIWHARVKAENEVLEDWVFPVHRDVQFVAKHRTLTNLKVRNSPQMITQWGEDPPMQDLLESIADICKDFPEIKPHEWQFYLVGGFDASHPLDPEDDDDVEDYDVLVSEWRSFDFDYQLKRI